MPRCCYRLKRSDISSPDVLWYAVKELGVDGLCTGGTYPPMDNGGGYMGWRPGEWPSPGPVPCTKSWVIPIMVWDIIPMILLKNSLSSSLSGARVSFETELLARLSLRLWLLNNITQTFLFPGTSLYTISLFSLFWFSFLLAICSFFICFTICCFLTMTISFTVWFSRILGGRLFVLFWTFNKVLCRWIFNRMGTWVIKIYQ